MLSAALISLLFSPTGTFAMSKPALVVSAAMLLVVLSVSTPSLASVQVGDLLKLGDGLGSPGGIAHIDDLNDAGSPNFDSFCVEITELVNPTDTYAVENIGLVTMNGGKVLTPYTAWLYNRFLDRTTNGFSASFNAANIMDVNALQLAIWLGIGYTPADIISYAGMPWYFGHTLVLNTKPWQADFAADVSWSGVGPIRIMNLRRVGPGGIYTDYAQDQLVRTNPVPEPLSFVVWCLLLGGAGAARFSRAKHRELRRC
jgi:hypothetical protein